VTTQVPHDDAIDEHIATFTNEERAELAAADVALDIASLLYRARKQRRLSQQAAAMRAHLQQQAISRMERASVRVSLATLQRYLGALGYSVDLVVKDAETGEIVGSASLRGLAGSSRASE
jgi:transcriptional regulator with XRE-family HTH domain